MARVVLTDGEGCPFPEPTPPAPGAPVEEVITYLRAVAARNDAIAACASGAFDRAFRKGVRGRRR